MSSEKTVAQSHTSDALAEVSGWLDAFPESAEQVHAQKTDAESLPFAEWCIVPVALLFIVGDMLFQFFG